MQRTIRGGQRYRSRFPGFTLVELLVVIAIIALLASLLTVVAARALRSARIARISLEVGSIAQVLEDYKNEYGAYPPDFALADGVLPTVPGDSQEIERHLARNFRTRDVSDVFGASGWTAIQLDPSEALYFWLGGTPQDVTKWPGGFSKDVRFPKTGKGDRQPRFEFAQERLRDADGDGFLEYYPPGVEQPYLYFNSKNYVTAFLTPASLATAGGAIVRPYAMKITAPQMVQGDFAEPQKFQLITAGLDGDFGTIDPSDISSYLYPDGPYTDGAHRDNVTNFAGGTLESKLP